METEVYPRLPQEAQEKTSIAEVVEKAEQTCESCRLLTPITCVTRCNIWKLKKELRKLYAKMKNPNFTANLLNALKNRRRLQILTTLSNGRYSIVRLQQELKKLGYYHSRRTITAEYINPLIEVGLVEKNHNKYHTTLLGRKLNGLLKDFSDIEELLPPHSECYEEKAIKALSESPKGYEELKLVIPTESLSRVLKRLHDANLMTKSNENSYIFYFKTKRDPQKEKLSPTEKRVYVNILQEGITAKKLADKTNISLRRTYKYLRKLKGKKLVFKRKRPKTYTLTKKGTQAAKLHEKINGLLLEFSKVSAEFTMKSSRIVQQILVPDMPKNRREKSLQILVRSNA
jgi:predicted transcriptional regulator